MRLFRIFALFVIMLCAVSGTLAADPVQPLAVHHIGFANRFGDTLTCSATAVGPHTILTASHCLFATNRMAIDGLAVNIISIVNDESDHVLITLDVEFDTFTRISTRAPEIKQHVRMCGYPGDSTEVVCREGYVKEIQKDFYLFILPSYHGDSGSGILANDGSVIAVLSTGNSSARSGAWRLAFTPEQLKAIK